MTELELDKITVKTMLEVEVRFFARARELAGSANATLSLPAGATVEAAVQRLAVEFPRLGPFLKSCRVALNEEFAGGAEPLAEGSVLAVIPPVSGG